MTSVPHVELRQCTGLEKGKPPLQQPYYGDGAALYLTPEYLRGAATACDSVKPSTNAVRVDSGDTILLWDGSNAGEVLRGRPGILASTMSRVAPDVRFLSPYFFYALKRWEAYLKGQTSGSGIPHVDKEILGRLTIAAFEKPQQSKIAEILATVDRAIEQTEALIAKQHRIRTGLMQDLLTRGIDDHGNLRSESTHEFKASPRGRIPVEWQCDVGARFFDLRAGIPVSRLMRSQDGNALFLKVDDFNDPANANGLIRSEYTFVCTPILESRLLQPGTIVFPKRGAAIFVNRVELLKRTGTLDPNLMGLIPKSRFLPEFMRLVLLHRNLGTICDNSGIPQINNKHLYPLLFMMPGYEEQREIVTRVMKSEGLLFASTESVQKLQRLRTGMMQDLLTGNRRVTSLLKSSPEEAAS